MKTGDKMSKFSKEQIEILKTCYWDSSWEEIFQKMNCNDKIAIISLASKHKIRRNNPNRLTKSEQQYIIEQATNMSVKDIAYNLGKKTCTISQWASDHNVSVFFPTRIKPWEESLFKKIYPVYTNKYLSKNFFPYLTPAQLRNQAKRFNLVKSKEKGVKWYDKDDILIKLEQVCTKIKRVPLLSELVLMGLPSEKTFCRYFGSLDKACELIGWHRPVYSNGILPYGALLDKNNNKCYSYTEMKISNFLIDQGYIFEKEKKYSDIIDDPEASQKRFDWVIGNKYIEYFGMMGYKNYTEKAMKKIELCKKYNIDLLSIFPVDMLHFDVLTKKIIQFLQS